jgi:hypothetical protein
MKLSEPKVITFWVAVLLGLLGLLGLVGVAVLSNFAGWLCLAGLVVLVLGNAVKGL